MKPPRLLLIAVLFGMAGCGRVADLKPAAGRALPVKPLMARKTPTPQELLALPPYAKPDRVDELVKRSQPPPSPKRKPGRGGRAVQPPPAPPLRSVRPPAADRWSRRIPSRRDRSAAGR